MRELTPKQQRFVEEYLIDLNATQAAIRAGYSEKSAGDLAAQLLGKTHIREAIEQAKQDRSEKTNVDAAWLLNRLREEAEADIADLYDDDGNLLPVKQWPKIWRQGLVQGVDIEAIRVEGVEIGKVKKIKLDSRIKRTELIGRHVSVKAFEDQISVTGLDALADRLARASKR